MAHLINDGLPFLRADCVGAGFGCNEFTNALRWHAIRRVFHGVYIDNTVEDTRDTRIMALRLVMSRNAVVCGCSAAWLMCVDVFPPGRQFDFTPECVVPVGKARNRSPLISCRRALLASADIMETGGLLHTTPVRTASDLLRTLRRPYALAAGDALAHAQLVTPEGVRAYLERLHGYPGVIQAKELAQWLEPKSESPGESWQRLRLVDAGLPRPEPQFVVCDRFGRVVARLDNAYVDAKIGLEYDGKEFHTLDEDKDANAHRKSVLVDTLGWRMENSDKADILGKDPAFEIKIGGWLGMTPALPRNW